MADIRISGASALTFSFSTQALRVVMIDGEPWFVAADVCEALSIGNVSLAVNGRADRTDGGLDDDEKGVATVNTPSGEQQMLTVNESGLYALIFKSRKPEAKKFKKWVTAEVLPAIRKTGRYEAQPQQPRHAAREQLNSADMQNLRRLIWLLADRMHYKEVWSQAIWCYLRQVLNHPTPHPFYVDQLPVLQQEIAGVLSTGIQVKQIIARLEQEAARRIFRRGEVAGMVLPALEAQARKDMQRLIGGLGSEYSLIEHDLKQLLQRTTPYMGSQYCVDEQPDFFGAC